MSWSTPDSRGICTKDLDVGAKRTLRGKRLKRSFLSPPKNPGVLGADHLETVRLWVATISARRKWNSMLTNCTFAQAAAAPGTLELLVEYGWVQVEEKRSSRGWEPAWVEFLDLEGLRERLGLTNRAKERATSEELSADFVHPQIRAAFEGVRTASPAVRIKRHNLLLALDQWVADSREGTRRDFSLVARGDTKGVTPAEWQWLDAALNLESLGVVKHTPQIRISFPGQLVFLDGTLDARVLRGPMGLDPEDITRVLGTRDLPEGFTWKIRENFTTFQKAVQEHRDTSIVVWVPGFAPHWWLRAVEKLLEIAPGPLEVGCDPDPSGVMIAMQVVDLWESLDLPWTPVGMSGRDIQDAPAVKELNASDRKAIEGLLGTPSASSFHAFLLEMQKLGVKAEQEGIL